MIRPLVLITLLSFFYVGCSNSPLKKDESVIFFPTSANQENNQWKAKIHSWVFEKEEGDLSRIITQKGFKEIFEELGALNENQESALLKQRLAWFLVDNQRNKTIEINLQNKHSKLNQTTPNGHAFTDIVIKQQNIKTNKWLNYSVNDQYQRDFSGMIQLIPDTGLSIISDIDDTIKISNVLNKKELIINTFVKPYAVTKGFPTYYKKLKNKGAFFHYVSASPWQLYPSLKPFLDKYYPKGTITLRNFRLKDASLLAFLKPSTQYKITQIKNIIHRYPKHQFMLIGDSGEHDPEVYAKIYQQFPQSIQAILIRAVEGSDLSSQRFIKTFIAVPKSIWSVIKTPEELDN